MKRSTSLAFLTVLPFIAFLCRGEDAAELERRGIAALKESQTHPGAIVEAARMFVQASAAFEKANNSDKAVEMNSYLYWCKKKMTIKDMDSFVNGGGTAVTERLNTIQQKPEVGEAQKWYDRAEVFARGNPDEHLLIAIRFYEVADRFVGSDAGNKAQERSLRELQRFRVAPKTPSKALTKAAVPDPAKQTDAVKAVREQYAAEYKKADPAAAPALSAMLLKEASSIRDDPLRKYALLSEARDIAAQNGAAESAVQAIEKIAEAFKIDVFAEKTSVIKRTSETASAAAAHRSVVMAALKVTQEAVLAEQFDKIAAFAGFAESSLAKAADKELAANFQNVSTLAADAQKELPAVKAALQQLKSKPQDPAANLVIARNHCIFRNDWEKGLAAMALCSNAGWKALAEKELAKPDQPAQWLAIADGWWEQADKLAGGQKTILKFHAADWYGRAVPRLEGISRVKAESRRESLAGIICPMPLPPRAQAGPANTLTLELPRDRKMEFVLIQPGSFQMGSEAHGDTFPTHLVRISKPYYLSIYEVTKEQFEALSKSSSGVLDDPKVPANSISHTAAVDFCHALSRASGRVARLPTEAEWEYACRAGSKTEYCNGNGVASLDKVGWYSVDGTATDKLLSVVGKKAPNAWGLYDMHGNVFEWCDDYHDGKYYQNSPQADPVNRTPAGSRVARGGSVFHAAFHCTSAVRASSKAARVEADTGFRVLVEAEGP